MSVTVDFNKLLPPPEEPGEDWPPPSFGESNSIEVMEQFLQTGKTEEGTRYLVDAAGLTFCPRRSDYKLWYFVVLKLFKLIDHNTHLWIFRRLAKIRKSFLLSLQKSDHLEYLRMHALALEACSWTYSQQIYLLQCLGRADAATKLQDELNSLVNGAIKKTTYPKTSGLLDEAKFWVLIEESKDSDGIIDFADLEARLAAHKPKQIIEFAKILDGKITALYTSEILKYVQSHRSLLSDDGYEYFCAGVVALGRSKYEKFSKNPASLSDEEIDQTSAEELLLVPEDAYEAAEGSSWSKKFSRSVRPSL